MINVQEKRNRHIFEDGFYKDYIFEPTTSEWKKLLAQHGQCIKIQALGFEEENSWLPETPLPQLKKMAKVVPFKTADGWQEVM